MNKTYDAFYQEFNENGVAILPQVLSDDDLQPAIQDIEQWIDRRAKRLKEKGEIQNLFETEPFETRYARLFEQSSNIAYGFDVMYMLGEGMFNFFNNAKLLDAIEPLVGPEITCNPIQHVRAKPPNRVEGHKKPSFHNVPWHQDAGVMMKEAEDSNILTCWIPLVDVTREMGCLRALPKVSQHGYLPHIAADETMIDPNHLPACEPLDLTCKKGDVIIMSRFTPHSSTPNESELCRWSLDLRYQTTGHHSGRTAHPEFVTRSQRGKTDSNYDQWKAAWIDAIKNPRGFSGHRIHQ